MSRGTIIRKLDKLCSTLVRRIGKCAVCGNTETLQTHHVIGRRNMQVRFYLNNLLCLCALHHRLGIRSAHQDPAWFIDWYKKFLGEEEYQRLIEVSNKTDKIHTYQLQELYDRMMEIV